MNMTFTKRIRDYYPYYSSERHYHKSSESRLVGDLFRNVISAGNVRMV